MSEIVRRFDAVQRVMNRLVDRWWWIIPIVFAAVAWHEGWL